MKYAKAILFLNLDTPTTRCNLSIAGAITMTIFYYSLDGKLTLFNFKIRVC